MGGKPIWENSGNSEADEFRKCLYGYLSRHLVCLTVRFRYLDENGRPAGKEHFRAFSGFVLSLDSHWFLVTAGHILKELHRALTEKKIQIESSTLADFFGKGAKVPYPTPFPFEHAPKRYVDDKQFGLDLGLVYLREFFREGLLANGIKPITEENWLHQHRVDFQTYYLLGFPEELVKDHNQPIEPGQDRKALVAPVIISARKLELSEVPDTIQIPPSRLPWFIGKLSAGTFNIKGMSGGPVFGLRQQADGGIEYWVVALQSRWFEPSRIILACPVPIFADLVREALRAGLWDHVE